MGVFGAFGEGRGASLVPRGIFASPIVAMFVAGEMGAPPNGAPCPWPLKAADVATRWGGDWMKVPRYLVHILVVTWTF